MKNIKKVLASLLSFLMCLSFPFVAQANDNQMNVHENLISDVDCYNVILKYSSDDYFIDIAFNEVSKDKSVTVSNGQILSITTDSGVRESGGGTGNTLDEAERKLHWYYGNDQYHVVCTNKLWSFTLTNDNDESDVITGTVEGFGDSIIESKTVDFDSHYSINQTLSASGMKVGTYTARLNYNYQLKYRYLGVWNNEDIIDSYIEFKVVVTVNTEAYDNVITRANTILSNETLYTPASFYSYKAVVDDVKQRRKKVTTQQEIDALTQELMSAESLLVEKNETVKMFTVNGFDTPVQKQYASVLYGTTLRVDSGSDSVTKWIYETVGDLTSNKLETTDGAIDFKVVNDTNIYAFFPEDEVTTDYSRFVFYSKDSRIVNIAYVKKGSSFDTSTVEGPTIPFYTFVGWDINSVVATQDEYSIRPIYKAN